MFHFDGKFFHTLKHLVFRPGFIPKEYVAGKRMSYLDPIRMYLFTSAVFFLIFFSMNKSDDGMVNFTGDRRLMSKMERLEYASILHQQQKAGKADTLALKQLNYLLDTTYRVVLVQDDTLPKPDNDSTFLIHLDDQNYLLSAYRLKKGQGDIQVNVGNSWLEARIREKWKAYKQRFADDEKAMLTDMIGSFLHKFPYILFVSLPFFALILKLLYIRRKHFFYSDHAVFTLYHYIFTFILLLCFFFLIKINEWLQWGVLTFFSVALFLSGGVYLYIAMKRFYAQGWAKTLGKFLLLNIIAFFLIIFLMLVFILFSVFQL
ncbi:MAG: DUF3667 domain-containing protein [Chitinophagaceae bacterium]|nr:MAG: DUF3667 domain-containing protein [Chitinophagaceae bacterium]